jgi:hypothetical protein
VDPNILLKKSFKNDQYHLVVIGFINDSLEYFSMYIDLCVCVLSALNSHRSEQSPHTHTVLILMA